MFKKRPRKAVKTFGNQGWTLDQVTTELGHKTNWGRSVVADLVAEIERLQALVGSAGESAQPEPDTGKTSDGWLGPVASQAVSKRTRR